jgi:N-acyl-D-amino-acid deacylase
VARLDLVVRNGTVVDGSGAPRRRADVAVAGGRIVAVGAVDGRGAREIDAEGHVVAPGFVDAHTHLDAQVFWDELGSSSCWHGVTTAVMGNCGFTLAPARPEERALVVRNLERAEDISAEAMAAGIDWSWGTFAEYLDAVERRPKGLNYAALIGHSALRTWAMGERAFSEAANAEDLDVMARELRAALRAGAVGFSTSRSPGHFTSDDRPVASRLASWDEVAALVDVVGRASDGGFQLAPENHRGDPDATARYEARIQQLALTTGVPVIFGVGTSPNTSLIDDTVARGGRMHGLTHCRGLCHVQSFQTRLVFDVLPEWRQVRERPVAEQRQLLSDPEVRARLVHAARHGDYGDRADNARPNYAWLEVMSSPYLPNPSVQELASERGVDPVELMIDLALEHDFDVFFLQYFSAPEEGQLVDLLKNPNTAMTFSDSGAHVSEVIDFSIQTHLLAYWVRERQALTIEEAIPMITSRPAAVWNLRDRGLVREGYAADLTIFDPGTVAPDMPRLVHDLPAGARRLVQTATGYLATVVNGEVLTSDGEAGDARPGRLLRSGHPRGRSGA